MLVQFFGNNITKYGSLVRKSNIFLVPRHHSLVSALNGENREENS